MIFELFILIFAAVLLVLILKKYDIKRHKLTRLLFLIFLGNSNFEEHIKDSLQDTIDKFEKAFW